MEKILERDGMNKMLAGVAAGLAKYFNVEVVWIRILFVCLTVFGFAGVWIYLILWIVIPEGSYRESPYHRVFEENTDSDMVAGKRQRTQGDKSSRSTIGLIMILLGIFFLINEFVDLPDWVSFEKLWPVLLIAIGLVILFGREKKVQQPGGETKKEHDPATGENMDQRPGDKP